MVRMTDCSFAPASWLCPGEGHACPSCMSFLTSGLLGLSHFFHWRPGSFQGGTGIEKWWVGKFSSQDIRACVI